MNDVVDIFTVVQYIDELQVRLRRLATEDFVQSREPFFNLKLMNCISAMIDDDSMTEEELNDLINRNSRLEFVFDDGTYTIDWKSLIELSTDELEFFKTDNPDMDSMELPKENVLKINEK
jgi:hypothetical protein